MRRSSAQPTQAQLDNLADTFVALSDADKSMLITAVAMQEPNAAMMTAVESANFPLWTRLAAFGWMEQLDLDEPLKEAGLAKVLSKWRLTDLGRARLPIFLGYAEDRAQGVV